MEFFKKLWENKMMRIFIVAIIFVILIILIAILFLGKTKKVDENVLLNAAKKYYTTNSSLLPQNEFDSTTVSLATLVSSGYINSDSEGANCNSYVTVIKMNGTYQYAPIVNCNTSQNNLPTLISKITTGLTTTGEGMHSYNGKYIYRGQNPNNYVLFGGKKWRILGIDANNNIKKLIFKKKNKVYKLALISQESLLFSFYV